MPCHANVTVRRYPPPGKSWDYAPFSIQCPRPPPSASMADCSKELPCLFNISAVRHPPPPPERRVLRQACAGVVAVLFPACACLAPTPLCVIPHHPNTMLAMAPGV